MIADSDVQVWLETVQSSPPSIVVPYVQSDHNLALHYRVRVVQEGHNGKSVIGQAGAVNVLPNTPTALSQFRISRQPESRCEIEITLTGSHIQPENHRFECPS